MNRMTVLIALLGLALFAGCNQSDGSGSEWICAEGRVGNPNDQDWQCYSQLGWQQCSFKYVCSDASQEEWFCERLNNRPYNDWCDDQYICEDHAGHYWACDSEASQAYCETNYFENPSDFFLCNSADRNQDPEIWWACPDQGGNLPLAPKFRQITVQTINPDPPPSIRSSTEDAPCNIDPIGEGCTKIVADQVPGEDAPCTPLWSMDGRSNVAPTAPGAPPAPPPENKGAPKNYCNPVTCTRI